MPSQIIAGDMRENCRVHLGQQLQLRHERAAVLPLHGLDVVEVALVQFVAQLSASFLPPLYAEGQLIHSMRR